MRGLAGLLGAVATMAPPSRGDVAVLHNHHVASALPAHHYGDGERFDPSWWLRRGAARNQRERRRDFRRRGH